MTCATLAGAALFQCLAANPACLPPQHTHHLPLILSTIQQESRATRWVVRNEREGKGHYFPSKEAAIAYAVEADRQGAVLGIGPGQITHRANWRMHTGLDGAAAIAALLDPCTNLRATANHYAAAFGASIAYNAGAGRLANPPAASTAYAQRVVTGATQMPATTTATPQPEPPPDPNAPPSWDVWATLEYQQRRASAPPDPPAEADEAAPALVLSASRTTGAPQ